MRPKPQPLHDCKTSSPRTSLRSGDTMGIGGGARPQQTQSAVRPHQVLTSVPLFLLLLLFSFVVYTGLRSPEALSGSRSAELTMQQPGRDNGYDEHPGGLHYEHYICLIHYSAAYPWRETLLIVQPLLTTLFVSLCPHSRIP